MIHKYLFASILKRKGILFLRQNLTMYPSWPLAGITGMYHHAWQKRKISTLKKIEENLVIACVLAEC
jgi:hypothetical protein